MNYIEMKGLMSFSNKDDRMKRLLKCKLFPEAVFRGEKFTEVCFFAVELLNPGVLH